GAAGRNGVRQGARRERRERRAAGALLALALVALAGCGQREPDRPRNVLLLTLDTVRADRLGAYGYSAARTPHLDALAARGVRFDDAVAPSPITGPSHASIF